MRGISTFSTAILAVTALAGADAARAAPDLSPVACVWEKLPPAEQQRLRDGFKVDLGDNKFKLQFASADPSLAAPRAQECRLNLSAPQLDALAEGLARHGAAAQAKLGISDRGEDPGSVDLALSKMYEGKREAIGDRLSCPGSHAMVGEWDKSLKNAVQRANVRLRSRGAFSWVFLAMYAVMAEEGAVRRMTGQTGACS